MNKSDSISNLAVALAKAQAELPAVKENSVNPFLKSRFADLGAVIQTARPVLAKHGLAISQFPVGDGERIGVETMILHASGEWLADVLYLPLEDEKGKSRAQVAGSIVTYLRRYSLSAVLGMYSDEDADGQIAPVARGGDERSQAIRQPVVVAPTPSVKQDAPPRTEWHEEALDESLMTGPIAPPLPSDTPRPITPPPFPASKPLPPGVVIPSKQNGGNKETARALIRTGKWNDYYRQAVALEWIPKDDKGYRLLAVAKNAGYTEITDDNINDVWSALERHYAAKKELEAAPAP